MIPSINTLNIIIVIATIILSYLIGYLIGYNKDR